jgi:NodT family efflux transporter outer membrane factor (OMF) lipoprotein
VEAADASQAAAREQRNGVLITLEAEIARNYIELRGVQERLATIREIASNQEKIVELIADRLRIGLNSELQLAQAKTQHYTTQSQLPDLERKERQAILQLGALSGTLPQQLPKELYETRKLPVVAQQLPAGLPSDLLRRRPDIRSAERQLAASTAAVGAAMAELFPHFSLGAMIGFESTKLSNLVTAGSQLWSAGPSIAWSLFNGGKVQTQIAISESERERARANYEKTVLDALIEVESTLNAYAKERDAEEVLANAASSAQEASTLARNQFEAGFANFLDVLQSEYALNQSKDQLIQSRQRLSTNMVALFKALGGGWELTNPQYR